MTNTIRHVVMDSGLRAALEGLYDAFSRYRLPDGSEVCEHCVGPETVQTIRATPLRALEASAMECYAWNVSTWGMTRTSSTTFPA